MKCFRCEITALIQLSNEALCAKCFIRTVRHSDGCLQSSVSEGEAVAPSGTAAAPSAIAGAAAVNSHHKFSSASAGPPSSDAEVSAAYAPGSITAALTPFPGLAS